MITKYEGGTKQNYPPCERRIKITIIIVFFARHWMIYYCFQLAINWLSICFLLLSFEKETVVLFQMQLNVSLGDM